MSGKVNASSVSAAQTSQTQNNPRPLEITIKSGDTFSALAKKYGITIDEFKALTGATTLKAGATLKFKTAEVPSGKGIMALAAANNMDFEAFCKLNNIPKPYKNYVAKKGEQFYIVKDLGKPKAENAEAQTPTPTPTPQPSDSSNKAKAQDSARVQKKDSIEKSSDKTPQPKGAAENEQDKEAIRIREIQAKYGSSYTPEELSENILQKSKYYYGAVGKPDFDNLLNEINPKNVEEVIKKYTENKLNKSKESLIYTITTEISSKTDARKDATMKIVNTLAQTRNVPKEKIDEFKTELDKQFNSFGMVSTKKLDAIIDEIIAMPLKSVTPAQPKKSSGSSNNTKVKTTNGKEFTVSALQNGAIASAKNEALKNFEKFCKANKIKYDKNLLDLTPLERIPEPTLNGNKITTAETALLAPTVKANGKVVILNPGHGGYSSRNGFFDPGAYSFIKKANGKYAPLVEYEKMKNYAEKTADKLRAEGYAVVITSGHAQTISDNHSMSNLVSRLKNGSLGGKKYTKDNIAFISLHADSDPSLSGTGVCYDPRFTNDTEFANSFNNAMNQDDWISSKLSQRKWGTNGIQVLHQTEDIPSVLIEVEYVNGSKSKNLDSSAFQTRFQNQLIVGLNNYFGGIK